MNLAFCAWSIPRPPRTNSEGREPLVLHHQGLPPFVDNLADVRGTMMNLRAPSPITRGLMLEVFALLALAVLVGIFVHSIIPLLVAD